MVSMARDDTRTPAVAARTGQSGRSGPCGGQPTRRRGRSARLAALVLAVGLLQGCATALDTTVTTFHEPEASWVGKRFAIVPDGDQRDSLEFQSYAAQVGHGLQRNGLVPAGGGRADVDVHLRYQVEELRPLRYSTPVYGGIGPGWAWGPYPYAYPYGFYYGRPPYWPMGYMMIGADTREYRTWRHELKVDLGKAGESARQFQATASTESGSASLVSVMPALVEAIFHDFPGPNGQVRHVPVQLREPEPTATRAPAPGAAAGSATGAPAGPADGQSSRTQVPSN